MKRCRICGATYDWWKDHICAPAVVCPNCWLTPCGCED